MTESTPENETNNQVQEVEELPTNLVSETANQGDLDEESIARNIIS